MCERTIAEYEEGLCCVKMCERTIAEYEEELTPTKEENERQRQLLEAVFKRPQVVLHRTAEGSGEALKSQQRISSTEQFSSMPSPAEGSSEALKSRRRISSTEQFASMEAATRKPTHSNSTPSTPSWL
ncbi:uncharacterized protein LOC133541239 isoform X2 [Nerophis ophidion]|uniref:uncharacterized protein LOC133541239 isoform X2 n=1 Tax=Nerophis ophidion TaxID=159077 RepID=UPI002ADF7D07|nr:uncharacterized protein LOC133541239 isoform X2 [Nerophis ophidion]